MIKKNHTIIRGRHLFVFLFFIFFSCQSGKKQENTFTLPAGSKVEINYLCAEFTAKDFFKIGEDQYVHVEKAQEMTDHTMPATTMIVLNNREKDFQNKMGPASFIIAAEKVFSGFDSKVVEPLYNPLMTTNGKFLIKIKKKTTLSYSPAYEGCVRLVK